MQTTNKRFDFKISRKKTQNEIYASGNANYLEMLNEYWIFPSRDRKVNRTIGKTKEHVFENACRLKNKLNAKCVYWGYLKIHEKKWKNISNKM